jgi:chaperone modulatory protein CbpM
MNSDAQRDSPQAAHADAALLCADLSLDELCRAVAVSREWVVERVEAGVVQRIAGEEQASWRFDVVQVTRARRIARVERDFDAAPELAALVADLQDEIAALRRRLSRLGG